MILILIVVFSALFVVTHLGMSHGAIRENLVAKLGQWPFRGLYSLVSFFIIGIVGPFHMDARLKKQRGEGFAEFCRQTSVIPFVAIIRKRTTFSADEISFPLFLIGVIVYVVLAVFHGTFFGSDIF